LLKLAFCEEKSTYLGNVAKEGQQGLRHLAIAYKEVAWSEDVDLLEQENNLSFLGYVSLTDPLRSDTKETITKAEQLGVSIKILTGDSREVSAYVGREIGLLKEGEVVYVGDDLDTMTHEELKDAVKQCNVFARVSPERKFLLIKTLKEKHIVGYQVLRSLNVIAIGTWKNSLGRLFRPICFCYCF
jgi:magnesium-transporting ATPase (P-type)